MEKLKMHSPNLTQDNIARIRDLFPGCVTEAKGEDGSVKLAVDFDQLRQELTESIVEGPQERYHLNWPGKREALLTANAPIAKTLRPCREESVDFDATKNIFIEGDNLDALKLLQETYLGKVKIIYIDPPYNTGQDFIYKDNYSESSEDYLKYSNQIDPEGSRLSINTESCGRFHSSWLSMMAPRLRLARNLLREDGVIFVSIGVEELSNLKKLMDEIYGEGNFIEVFSWVKTSTPPALSTKSRKTNEYILCYEKTRNSFQYRGEPLDGGDQPLLNSGNSLRPLKFPHDKVVFTYIENGTLPAGRVDRVELMQDLEIRNGYATDDFVLSGEFKWTQAFLDEEVSMGTTFVIKSDKLSVRFIRTGEGFKRPTNLIKEKYTSPVIDKKTCAVGTNEAATAELSSLMGGNYFSYPKPVSLIEHLINFVLDEDDLVLDFFAGSGTTAHAVLNWCSGRKPARFILVQIQENLADSLAVASDPGAKLMMQNGIRLLEELGRPPLLSELTKIRLKKTSSAHQKSTYSSGGIIDSGFRVLTVDSSNMADVYYAPDALDKAKFDLFVDNIKPDRTPEDLLFQVMLDWGVDLALPIAKQSIQGKDVFFVDGNALAACFDASGSIDEAFVKELAKHQPLRVVFRDAGYKNSAVKINVEQIFKLLSPATEVKCI